MAAKGLTSECVKLAVSGTLCIKIIDIFTKWDSTSIIFQKFSTRAFLAFLMSVTRKKSANSTIGMSNIISKALIDPLPLESSFVNVA